MNEGKNLRLPRTMPIGPGQAAAQTVSQKWDTADDVEAELHMKGFKAREKPVADCPELTEEMLTTTDSKSYTETYALLLAWFGYSSELYARVQADVLQFKNMRDILAAEGRKVAREIHEGTKKPTKEELEDRLLLNPEYQDVMLKMQRYQQAELLFKAKVESIERSLRVISRQVEIRRLDMEQTKTGANMPGRGFQPGGYTGGGRFGKDPG